MKDINSILYTRKPRVNNIRLFFTMSHSCEMMAQVLAFENNTTFDQETRGEWGHKCKEFFLGTSVFSLIRHTGLSDKKNKVRLR